MRAMPESSSLRWFAAFLAVVAALAGVEIYSLVAHNRERAAAVPQATAPRQSDGGRTDRGDRFAGRARRCSVRASPSRAGRSTRRAFATVEVRADGRAFAARIGIPRHDVAKANPAIADNANGGYEFTGDFATYRMPAGADRRVLSVVAVARDGRESVLGTRSLIEPSATDALVRVQGEGRNAVLSPARAVRCRSGRRSGARHGVRAVPLADGARRLSRADPLLAHDQGRRGGLRRSIPTGMRRASAASGASATIPSMACSPTRGPSGCRCWSRSTAASGPTRSATFRRGTSTTSSSRTRATANGTSATR